MFIQSNTTIACIKDSEAEEALKKLLPYLCDDEAILLIKDLKSISISEAVDWLRSNKK